MKHNYQADVVIIGGGLAGIVTAYELLDHNKSVVLLDRDISDNLGGLAKKSFGGIMMVGTPHQQKSKIVDTPDIALQDWLSYAQFGEEDVLPRQWAETYVNQSRDIIYEWLTARDVKFMPVVNWPERGYNGIQGNSVPRWHITWGTGYGLMKAILAHLEKHPKRAQLTIHFGHRVENLIDEAGRVVGCSGQLENGTDEFEARGDAVVVASGGVCGGDLSRVRQYWYKPWGQPPEKLLNGAHPFGDGLVHDAVATVGGNLTHLDKHWHYAAGVHHPKDPTKKRGISLVPPRSALWVNALGQRIGPPPLMGYTDTRFLIENIVQQPGKFSWQILNWKIAIKELAVSGSEYMKAYRNVNKIKILWSLLFGNKSLVRELIDTSEDFVVADSLPELVEKMNKLNLGYTVDLARLEADIRAYEAEIDKGPTNFTDQQLKLITQARQYRGDKLRTSKYQKILDPKAMPLIAIREFILSRKSMGGIQTNLASQVLTVHGEPIPGLYAVGEAAGFGGGGIHGLRSLEGTFLGGCVLTGRLAGQAIAAP